MNHDILQICESIALSAKDRREIDSARLKAADINSVIGKCLGDPAHAPRHEYFSWLHLEVDRCEAELVENPTHENAEKMHAAMMRFEQAKLSQERIGGALSVAAQKVSQSVAGIANNLLDQVRKTILVEADKRRAELATSNHSLFSNAPEKTALEARVQALIHALNAERGEMVRCPLGWLDRHGLALDDQTVPDSDEQAA